MKGREKEGGNKDLNINMKQTIYYAAMDKIQK